MAAFPPQSDAASPGRPLSNRLRVLGGTATVLIVLLLLASAAAVPFRFESPSLWYKFGIAKTVLRTGKMLGLATGLLILLQLPMPGG